MSYINTSDTILIKSKLTLYKNLLLKYFVIYDMKM